MDERRSADVRVPTRSNGAITLRQSPHARQEENASAQARPNEASVGDTYLRLPDNLALRNNRRSRRIATNKNRTTSATAAAGASNARKDIRSAPPSSAVAMTGFPRPPVKTGRVGPKYSGQPLCQAGDTAARDNSRRPFYHW